jgi:magnesium-transporting ATPase (P-type)
MRHSDQCGKLIWQALRSTPLHKSLTQVTGVDYGGCNSKALLSNVQLPLLYNNYSSTIFNNQPFHPMNYQYDNTGQEMFDRQLSYMSKAFKFLLQAFLLSPVLIAGMFIAVVVTEHVPGMKKSPSLLILFTAGFSYLIYCLIFFLKGIMLALRSNGRPFWILLYVLCIGITCSLPFIFVYQLFSSFSEKNPQSEQELMIWGFAMGGVVSYLAYQKYKFLTDVAPKSVFWAYNAGFKIGRSMITNPNEDLADISRDQML